MRGAGRASYNPRLTLSLCERHTVRFFLDPLTWLLIVIAAVSGGLLVWPAFSRARNGGVSPTEAVRLMNREKATVVDVSEAGEYAVAHVAGSRNIPLGRIDVAQELPKNKTLPIILVCATGKRAARAAKALEAKGYQKAVVLAGGLAAWKAANLPIESSKEVAKA
jgi:rhodanese-related sulfurtransferase